MCVFHKKTEYPITGWTGVWTAYRGASPGFRLSGAWAGGTCGITVSCNDSVRDGIGAEANEHRGESQFSVRDSGGLGRLVFAPVVALAMGYANGTRHGAAGD